MASPSFEAGTGDKPRRRSVERREAQAPTSLGLRIPGGGPDGSPVTRGQAPSQRVCQGSLASSHGVSQTPGASRRSITSLRRGEEKGKRRARAAKNRGQRSIGYSPPLAHRCMKSFVLQIGCFAGMVIGPGCRQKSSIDRELP